MAECINSWGTPTKCGHARIYKDGVTQYHHIIVMEAAHGRKLLPDEIVHHRCHNKMCIERSHLEIMKRWFHSRLHNKGAANANAKLSEDQINQVFAMRALKMPYVQIGRKLGVSKGCVNMILNRRTWKHVEISEAA